MIILDRGWTSAGCGGRHGGEHEEGDGKFSPGPNLSVGRRLHGAAVIAGGLLVAGGSNTSGGALAGAEFCESDTTPPAITVPESVEVDGVSPAGAGAPVGCDASAVDDVDPTPLLSCTPASGSVFPLLATKVTCVATDAAGNIATKSFTVFVKDAVGQLDDTVRVIAGWNLPRGGTGLIVQLFVAKQLMRLGHTTPACALIAGAMQQVRVMTGKVLTQEQTFLLLTRLARIRGVAGC